MKNSLPALTALLLVMTAVGGCFGDGSGSGKAASSSPTTGSGGAAGGDNGTGGSSGGSGGGGGNGTGGNESAPPVAVFTVAPANASQTNLTSGAEIMFDASGSSDPAGGPMAFSWSFGDGNSSSLREANHTFAAAGNYTVTLTVTSNASGLSDTESQLLVVEQGARLPTSFTDPSSDGTTNYHDLRAITISDDGEKLYIQFAVGALQPGEENEQVICFNAFITPAGKTAEQRYEQYSLAGTYYIYDYFSNPRGDMAGGVVVKVGTGYKWTMPFSAAKLDEKSFPLKVRLEARTSECAAVGARDDLNGPGKLDVAPNTGAYTYG